MKLHRHITFQKYSTLFLLVVILFFITPGELIHGLHNHEDTVDAVCMDACKDQVSAEHEHCDALQLTTPPLYHHVGDFSFNITSITFSFLVKDASAYVAECTSAFYLRGPPSVV
jgi:hypothetical protein